MDKKIKVTLYTVPQAACGSQQMSWSDVAGILEKQLLKNFNDQVDVEHVEFMEGSWFEDTHAQNILEKEGINLPFVLADGEVACAEKKVNISKVKKFVQNKINS